MRKIVITGPESSGKTTIAKQIASHYKVPLVGEYARSYLNKLGRAYTQADLLEIAKGQIELENQALTMSNGWVVCDTSLEVIKIWSDYKYKACDPFILDALTNRLPDVYLLMTPDLLWEYDPLRENSLNRDELFQLYKKELTKLTVPFYNISGKGQIRFSMAQTVIDNLLLQ